MSTNGRMVRLAAVGGARLHRLAQEVQDRYADPGTMTQAEADEHTKKTGHLYSENCNEPFCQKWRGMVNDAIAQIQQGQGQ